MHPVMFTIPGWGFKFIVPLLVLWGMYSIVVSANRAAPAKPGAKKAGDAEPEKKGFELPADSPQRPHLRRSSASGCSPSRAARAHGRPRREGACRCSRASSTASNWRRPVGVAAHLLVRRDARPLLVVGWYLVLGLTDRQKPAPRQDMADCYVFTAFAAWPARGCSTSSPTSASSPPSGRCCSCAAAGSWPTAASSAGLLGQHLLPAPQRGYRSGPGPTPWCPRWAPAS
jgi:hypothetical protein